MSRHFASDGEPGSPGMRAALVVLLLAVTGLLAVDLQPSDASRRPEATLHRALAQAAPAAPLPTTIRVPFFREGRLVRVERVVPEGVNVPRFALRRLFQGPTVAERRSGLRTAIPETARVRSLRADDLGWRLSVSRSTFALGTPETKRRRVWQIEATLAPLGDEPSLTLATEGRFLWTGRLGVVPGRWSAETGEGTYAYSLRAVQVRLMGLGYLDRASVTGSLDYLTEQALLAFQGWERLSRTATVTGETQRALFRAQRPEPVRRTPGRHVEISRELGVLLTVEDGEVVRAIHTSTGSFGRTPSGDFDVYAKSLYSWSVPFHVWMPFASYFHGGIAMHQSPDVPSYPASHGCVRLPAGEAERVYGFVDVGTPVFVR